MHLDVVHVFRQAAISVLESYHFSGIHAQEVRVCGDTFVRTGGVGVSLTLGGALCGLVGFAFSRAPLAGFVGRVVGAAGEPPSFEEQCDVLCEFANIVAGHAMGQLYGMGLGVDISPPSILPGPEVLWCFSPGIDAVVLAVATDQGSLEVVLAAHPV